MSLQLLAIHGAVRSQDNAHLVDVLQQFRSSVNVIVEDAQILAARTANLERRGTVYARTAPPPPSRARVDDHWVWLGVAD